MEQTTESDVFNRHTLLASVCTWWLSTVQETTVQVITVAASTGVSASHNCPGIRVWLCSGRSICPRTCLSPFPCSLQLGLGDSTWAGVGVSTCFLNNVSSKQLLFTLNFLLPFLQKEHLPPSLRVLQCELGCSEFSQLLAWDSASSDLPEGLAHRPLTSALQCCCGSCLLLFCP